MLASTLLGGALADRIPQRRILLAVTRRMCCRSAVVAALSLTGALELWQLAAVSLLDRPGHAASTTRRTPRCVPALLPEGQLLAANGLEGSSARCWRRPRVRPLAGLLVAALSPGAALAATAGGRAPRGRLHRGDADHAGPTGAVRRVLGGWSARRRPRGLRLHGAHAVAPGHARCSPSLMILVFIGPFEVLVPFAIRDAGGGPSQHALVLAAFGIGGAVGSLVVASLRLPRRYLTVMNVLWGLGCVPMVVFGVHHRAVADGRGRRRHGRRLPGGHGHLGHAAAAAGAAGPAGPGVQPRLLRVAELHAAVDGAGRHGQRGHRPDGDVPARRPRPAGARGARDRGARGCPPTRSHTRSTRRRRPNRSTTNPPPATRASRSEPGGAAGPRDRCLDGSTTPGPPRRRREHRGRADPTRGRPADRARPGRPA